MEKTFVVWNNVKYGFVESVGKEGVFYTENIDSAFQFPEGKMATELADSIGNCAVLKWL